LINIIEYIKEHRDLLVRDEEMKNEAAVIKKDMEKKELGEEDYLDM
jgi:hypothetical protein